jgi:hypothetical protein
MDKKNIAAAAIARLEAEKQRRIDEKVARGEAVRVDPLGVLVFGVASDEQIAAAVAGAKAKRIAELRAAGETREIFFDESPDDISVIVTGVPRCGRDEDDEGYDDEAPPVAKAEDRAEDFTARKRVAEALHAVDRPMPTTPPPAPSTESEPYEGPHHIHAQTRGSGPGDPGAIVEGSFTISSGGIVHVKDAEGRLLGTHVLQPMEDAAGQARKILREKRSPGFWGSIPYPTY